MSKIVICIATFKRDEALSDLLESITKLHVEEDCSLRVIVVDNFGEGETDQVCSRWRCKGSLHIDYYVESRKGVAHVRNKALDELPEDVQFVAFLDDDETVSEGWLNEMFNGMEKYDADICNGPVIPLFPGHTPDWIRRGGFLARKVSLKSGDVRDEANTGNVFFKREILNDGSVRFDPDFGFSGGEDTDFFHQFYLKGKRIVWVEEAKVYEPVDDCRLSARWILRRVFQGVNVNNRLRLKNDSSLKLKILLIVKAILRFTQFLMGSLFLPMALFRKEWGVFIFSYLMRAGAGFYAVYGKEIKQYGA